MIGGDIRVRMTLDDSDFSVRSARAVEQLNAMSKNMEQTARSTQALEGHFTSVSGVLRESVFELGAVVYAFRELYEILTVLPESMLHTTAEFERLGKLLEGLSSQSTDAGRKLEALGDMKFILNTAMTTPFEIQSITDAFIKLRVAGIDPTAGGLNALLNSVAKFGGDSETLKSATLAIQEMAGKGVISMKELRRQLGQAVPGSERMMAEGLGMSLAELFKTVQSGTLESINAVNRMFLQMKMHNDGAAKAMMETWNGMTEVAKTKYELFKKSVMDTGAFSELKSQLQKVIDAFDSPEAAKFARQLGEGILDMVKTVEGGAKIIIDNFGLIKLAIETFVAIAITNSIGAFSSSSSKFVALVKQQTASIIASHQQEQIARKAQLAIKEEDILREIQMNQRRVQAIAEADAAENDMRAASLAAELAAGESAVNNRKIVIDELAKVESDYLMQMIAIEEKQDMLRRRKKAGMKAAILDLEEERQALNRQASAIRNNVRNLEFEIATIERDNAVKLEAIRVTRNLANVMTEEEAALIAKNRVLAEEANATRAAAAETAVLTTRQATFRAAIEVTSTALKGFAVSMAAAFAEFAAIGLVVEGITSAYDAIAKAATEASDRVIAANHAIEATKNGHAGSDDYKAAQTEDKSLADQLDKYSHMLDVKEKAISGGAPTKGMYKVDINQSVAVIQADGSTIYLPLPKAIEYLKAQRATNQSYMGQMRQQVIQAAADAAAVGLDKTIDDAILAIARPSEIAIGDVDKQWKDSGYSKAMEKQHNDKLFALEQQRVTDTLNALDKIIAIRKAGVAEMQAKLAAAKAGGASDQVLMGLEASIAAHQESLDNAEKRYHDTQQEWKDYNPSNPVVHLNEKGGGEKEDPAIKALQKLKEQALMTTYELKGASGEMDAAAAVYQQAHAKIMEKVLGGEFDHAIMNAEGKKTGEYTMLGNRSADGFDPEEALAKATDAEKKFIAAMTEQEAIILKNTAAKNALSHANELMVSTQDDAESALESFSKKGIDDTATGLDKLEKKIKEYEAKNPLADSNAAYNNLLDQARAFQATTDAIEEAKKADEEYGKAVKDTTLTTTEAVKKAYERQKATTQKYYDDLREQVEKNHETEANASRDIAILNEAQAKKQMAQQMEYNKASETAMTKLVQTWSDSTKKMQDATASWAQSGVDAFVKFCETGKFNFKQLTDQILADILKIQVEKAVAGIVGGLTGIGQPTSMNLGYTGPQTSTVLGSVTPANHAIGFALGGIMTSFGSVPLRKYAQGGIADQPQAAVYGEGSTPEAFVPLPDGRTIPVSIKGGGGMGAAPQISINVINQSGQPMNAQQGTQQFDGQQIILDVVLTAATSPGSFRDGLRGAVK